jgi:hypothetical protein
LTQLVGSIPCASVFDSDFGLYGKFEAVSDNCLISQNELGSIDINLPDEFSNTDAAALAVGDWVGLLNNTIAAGGEVFSKTASGKAQVASPDVIPLPKLQVLYSTIVTACSDVIWDFSLSSPGSFI